MARHRRYRDRDRDREDTNDPVVDVVEDLPEWMTTGPSAEYNPETGQYYYLGQEYDLGAWYDTSYRDDAWFEEAYDYYDPTRCVWVNNMDEQTSGMFWNPTIGRWEDDAYWDVVEAPPPAPPAIPPTEDDDGNPLPDDGGASSDDNDDLLDDQTGDATENIPDVDYEGGVVALNTDVNRADVIRQRNLHYTAGSLTDMPDDLVRANQARSVEEARQFARGRQDDWEFGTYRQINWSPPRRNIDPATGRPPDIIEGDGDILPGETPPDTPPPTNTPPDIDYNDWMDNEPYWDDRDGNRYYY